MFFRIIGYKESDPWAGRYSHFEKLSAGSGKWKNLGPVAGYSSDYVYPIINKGCNTTAPCSDGGFGVMQLTIPAPTYKEIWNYKENINAAVRLIKEKLATAKAYPAKVRDNGCVKQPYYNDKKERWIYPCRPMPTTKKYKRAEDFKSYELRMDVYSLYNSNWHYWVWDDDAKEWIPSVSDPVIESQQRGYNYANHAESIENKIAAGNPPVDFN